MKIVKIEGTNRVRVDTPYNSSFVRRIKNVGSASWDGGKRCWEVNQKDVEAVRAIMYDVYGETDLPSNAKKYRVRLTFGKTFSVCRNSITILGKTVCRANGRDSGGKVGVGASFIKGQPESGGSVKNWESIIPEGSVVLLRDVPEVLVNRFDPTEIEGLSMELTEQEPDANKESLLAEREKLLARLAEIDALLENND